MQGIRCKLKLKSLIIIEAKIFGHEMKQSMDGASSDFSYQFTIQVKTSDQEIELVTKVKECRLDINGMQSQVPKCRVRERI